jgi:hypothetical protein
MTARSAIDRSPALQHRVRHADLADVVQQEVERHLRVGGQLGRDLHDGRARHGCGCGTPGGAPPGPPAEPAVRSPSEHLF